MKNTLLLFLLLITCSLSGFAQKQKADSLYSVLKTEKEDTAMVNTLNKLGIALEIGGDYKKSDSILMRSIQLAKNLDFNHGQAAALVALGNVDIDEGKYADSKKNGTDAIALYRTTNDSAGVAMCYNCLGAAYKDGGDFPTALKYFLVALKMREGLNNLKNIGVSYNSVGNVYSDLGDNNNAEINIQKAMDIFKKIGYKAGIAGTGNNLAAIYLNQGDYNKALEYYDASLKIRESINDRQGIASSYNNIGMVYDKRADSLAFGANDEKSAMKQYTLALGYYMKSLSIKKQIDFVPGILSCYNNIGNILIKMKDYHRAKAYLDSAIRLGAEIGMKELVRDAYNNLSRLDALCNDYKAAYNDFKMNVKYEDILANEENTKKLVAEQMQYDFDKKQAEEKAEQGKKDAIAEADKHKQQIITGAISAGLLLVVVFSVLLYSRFRVTQQQKKIIEEQKALVEEKNKDVLDSITYAKRLQDAILPPMSVIEKYLPDSFVLYKPKDIVAGDFYWIAPLSPEGGISATGTDEGSSMSAFGGGGLLIAAADCTGHGVPGAMVSVVCSNALNRTVKEFKITEPGKILDKTRELVLETFEKSEGDIKDGMDISLASIAPSNSPKGRTVIKWAGAYNSLWYIEDGELKELPADKQPIGKIDNPKPFTTHTITIPAPISPKGGNKENSQASRGALYLFTDGYADQFGGKDGKKYKYKQLQQLIVDNAHLPMQEQKKILEQELAKWKGSLEQVDDILIIGIRI